MEKKKMNIFIKDNITVFKAPENQTTYLNAKSSADFSVSVIAFVAAAAVAPVVAILNSHYPALLKLIMDFFYYYSGIRIVYFDNIQHARINVCVFLTIGSLYFRYFHCVLTFM